MGWIWIEIYLQNGWRLQQYIFGEQTHRFTYVTNRSSFALLSQPAYSDCAATSNQTTPCPKKSQSKAPQELARAEERREPISQSCNLWIITASQQA